MFRRSGWPYLLCDGGGERAIGEIQDGASGARMDASAVGQEPILPYRRDSGQAPNGLYRISIGKLFSRLPAGMSLGGHDVPARQRSLPAGGLLHACIQTNHQWKLEASGVLFHDPGQNFPRGILGGAFLRWSLGLTYPVGAKADLDGEHFGMLGTSLLDHDVAGRRQLAVTSQLLQHALEVVPPFRRQVVGIALAIAHHITIDEGANHLDSAIE